ncbi:MAG: BlaI/MecI/CopY family transcriptional regulator [Sciscionella sp.]
MRKSKGHGGLGATPRRGPGELASDVLAALWAARKPLTASQVQAELPAGLAYSTVVTILSRLHEKNVLARYKQGRAYAYTPVSDESGLAARRMRQVLDSKEDRGAVLARFVSELSETDEGLLRSLLRAAARDGKNSR